MLLRGQRHVRPVPLRPDAPARRELRVFPREEYLRTLLRPRETQPYAGDEVARRRGDGIEFADLRPFAFGDQRHADQLAGERAARRAVGERPPSGAEHATSCSSSTRSRRRAAASASTLDLALRAAATLARGYIGTRDRVGLVGFGGALRWLQPGTGEAQLYRICEALLDTRILLNYAWRDIAIVPARVLPPQSLVVALTPLLDERSVGALFDLRARGYDLAVIETSPASRTSIPGRRTASGSRSGSGELQRDALRDRLRQGGVAVVEWREGTPLAVGIEEVGAFRRHAFAGRG